MRENITPEAFKQARKAAGLSLVAAAKVLHRSARTLSYWESGGRPVDPACHALLLQHQAKGTAK